METEETITVDNNNDEVYLLVYERSNEYGDSIIDYEIFHCEEATKRFIGAKPGRNIIYLVKGVRKDYEFDVRITDIK